MSKFNKIWEGYYDEFIPGVSDEPRYGEVTPSWYKEKIAEVLKKLDNMDDLSEIKDFVTKVREKRIEKYWADKDKDREDEDRYDFSDDELHDEPRRRETDQQKYGFPGDR